MAIILAGVFFFSFQNQISATLNPAATYVDGKDTFELTAENEIKIPVDETLSAAQVLMLEFDSNTDYLPLHLKLIKDGEIVSENIVEGVYNYNSSYYSFGLHHLNLETGQVLSISNNTNESLMVIGEFANDSFIPNHKILKNKPLKELIQKDIPLQLQQKLVRQRTFFIFYGFLLVTTSLTIAVVALRKTT